MLYVLLTGLARIFVSSGKTDSRVLAYGAMQGRIDSCLGPLDDEALAHFGSERCAAVKLTASWGRSPGSCDYWPSDPDPSRVPS